MGTPVEFENVDLEEVLEEIDESGLSVSQAGDSLSQDDISSYRDLASGDGLDSSTTGDLNIVILDGTSAEGTGLRNLAQSVKDSTDADTVMVRAPHNSQVISDNLSRYQIESTQQEMHGSRAPEDVSAFFDASTAAEPSFGIVNILVLVGVLIAVVCATAFAAVTYRPTKQ